MAYSPYPQYKKTVAYWIDKRPAHWEERKLKFSVTLINEKVDARNSSLEYLGLEHIEPWTGKRIDGIVFESDGVASGFEKNDVLFGKLRPYLAKVHKAENDGIATTEALVLRADSIIKPEFLKYYLLSSDFIDVVDGSTYGSKMPRANWDFIENLSVLLPHLDEQIKIADFLDHKTTQIDRLIEKKKALIEKLNEKRIALITQAVTKGLNPDTPTKPSGVEWLGEVPEHWQVRRLKLLAVEPLKYGANEAAEFTDRDLPRYIRITDVREDGTLHDETFRSLPEDTAEPYLLDEGDILLARSGATVGKSFQYEKSWGIAAYAGYLIRFRADSGLINSTYAYFFFKTASYWANINSTLIQSTIQNFSAEKYSNIVMPLPPMDEQHTIVDFVIVEKSKIDRMEQKVREAITKLEEYRTALITAAVTGKIDVRNIELGRSG
ncbi:MAG: restriction endonuclease subunit S [Methylobacter sp.]|nr:restriction endonuclease subunit S [Methylobacter sp.]MDP2097549.1 restriction endonuclease subunit S [Methylobacter sp.]MDP2429390.1 restriction endonuclease subunit S [Methylobacter sp.]MDP3053815.1 restriction endonuclease subunit S [Methylobacter sp.]MDP3362798.1 restriction endonuclease subunit S [Methylobacter sp.]